MRRGCAAAPAIRPAPGPTGVGHFNAPATGGSLPARQMPPVRIFPQHCANPVLYTGPNPSEVRSRKSFPMSSSSHSANLEDQLREAILAQPDAVLEDQHLMNALVAANERAMGSNVVDLRGIAMERMAARLDRLEDTHRSVIAAAYDNLAGTNLIHRAVLRLMEPQDFTGFLTCLEEDMPQILRVDALSLVLETSRPGNGAEVERKSGVLKMAGPGFTESYAGQRGGERPVTLRQTRGGSPRVYGTRAESIASEACLMLDLGDGRLPGMLALGSEDPHQFSPMQASDLLTFFGGVFERSMRYWLA
jgi:uncharacterized protein YigA (DUF484 family)